MRATYKQLVNTNSIAIKNNKILTTKLASTEAIIKSLEERITAQSTTIANMTTAMDDIDTRMIELQNTVVPRYTILVEDTARNNVKDIVDEYCDDPSNTTKLQSRLNVIEDNTVQKVKDHVEEVTDSFKKHILELE